MIVHHGLHVALGFLGFWALYALCGLLVARLWLVPPQAFDAPEFATRWRGMLGETLVLLTAAAFLILLARTADMDDGSLEDVLADLPTVLGATHFGAVWSAHLAALLVLWIMCARYGARTETRAWAPVAIGAIGVLAFTYSATSHASSAGDFTLSELNDFAHVLSTAVWGGAIFACALLVFPVLGTGDPHLRTVAVRLSKLAGIALGVVLVTGTYNAALRLATWSAFFDTSYGRVLAVKVATVGLLTGVGAFNRMLIGMRIAPGAGHAPDVARRSLRLVFRALVVDCALVALAIVMAAYLVQSEPP